MAWRLSRCTNGMQRSREKRNLIEDVPHIITGEFRARACSTRTMDHMSPMRTGCRAITLPRHIPRAVASSGGVVGGRGFHIGPAPSLTPALRLLPVISGPIVFALSAPDRSKLFTALGLVVAITIPFGVWQTRIEISGLTRKEGMAVSQIRVSEASGIPNTGADTGQRSSLRSIFP